MRCFCLGLSPVMNVSMKRRGLIDGLSLLVGTYVCTVEYNTCTYYTISVVQLANTVMLVTCDAEGCGFYSFRGTNTVFTDMFVVWMLLYEF